MRKVTSLDVSRLANVSQSTVSFVLNNRKDICISPETRSRVLHAAKELKYGPFADDPNAVLRTSIAVFFPTFENPYYPKVLSAISEETRKRNINIILCCTHKSEKAEIDLLNNIDYLNVDSIIFTYTPLSKECSADIARRKKVFIISEIDFNINANIVTLNSKKAGQLVAEHLQSLGHKNIAYISTPMNVISICRKNRLEGIREYFMQNDIENNLIICAPDDCSTHSDPEVGYYQTLKLLETQKNITAIVGVNDYLTLGIVSALRAKNIRIPQDISVASFDNSLEHLMLNPKLTSVDHLIAQRVHYTIDLILSEIPFSQNIYITYDPILITRDSTSVCHGVK